MSLSRYFAMTPDELKTAGSLPGGAAYLSCRFGDSGLTDLPEQLPEGSMLILEDSRIPDVLQNEKILDQLTEAAGKFRCSGVLLDFQKPFRKDLLALALLLQKGLSCPVAVPEAYEKASEGPVFLSLLPAHRCLKDWARPYEGLELWLEIGPAPESALVTESGTQFSEAPCPLPVCPHRHDKLKCHYGLELKNQQILFTLLRTAEDLKALTAEAEGLGFTRTVGLYQELF